MKYLFLLAAIIMVSSPLCADEAELSADTRTYLRTNHHLDLLYTSLYGRHHPFKKYIAWHKHLIHEHATAYRSRKTTQKETRGNSDNKDFEINATLQTIQDYAHSLLQQYQIKPHGSSPLSGQLPLTALPGASPHSQLMVTPAPGVTPTVADSMLQQYITAMNSLQQQHNHDMPPFTQKRILREQMTFMAMGLGVIGILTVIGSYILNHNARKQLKVHALYEKLRNEMWEHSGRMSIIAQGGF